MFVPIHDDNKLKTIPFQYVTLLLIARKVAHLEDYITLRQIDPMPDHRLNGARTTAGRRPVRPG